MNRAPDTITAADIRHALRPLKAQGITVRLEQTGGGVATMIVARDGADTFALGPGRYDWEQPALSPFDASLHTTMQRIGTDDPEYLFHDWTDATIVATVQQAYTDIDEGLGD